MADGAWKVLLSSFFFVNGRRSGIMRYAKTFSMIFCLIVGIFVLGGCKEGNYSFERSSTVEVSSDSGINYSSKYSETRILSTCFRL